MKVELENIRLGVTAMTDKVMALIPSKTPQLAKHKVDVTSDFLKCIVDYGANKRFNIAGEDNIAPVYEVCVLEKKGFKQVLYSRKDVLKLLAQAIKEDIGNKINVEQFAEKHLK